MKASHVLAAAMLALLSGTSVYAQGAPLVVGGPSVSVLRTGTEVPMKLREELTTKGKALRVGQRFELEVADPVLVNGQTVIPAGSPGVGEITSIRNKGMWGKSGNIEARVLYVRVGDRQIRCSGVISEKGTTGTAGVVGAVVLIPVAGFFMTGTSAEIPLGAPVKAFLDEDVPVQFAQGSAPAPLVVTMTAPITPVATASNAGLSATATPAKVTPAVLTKTQN
jgi:hypothetical protein